MRIALVGGGMGGLAAAAFLRHAGLDDVTVFEQAPELGEIGAGIQLAPNAARLLHRLGLRDALDAAGTRLEIGWEMRRWEDGRVLSRMPFGRRVRGALRRPVPRAASCGAPGGAARARVRPQRPSRPSLRRCASGWRGGRAAVRRRAAVPCRRGDRRRRHPLGRPLCGRLAGSALVLGARGVPLRRPRRRGAGLAHRPVFASWLGPGRHLVHYPVSRGGDVNVIAVVPARDWRTESWVAEGFTEEFAAEFADWDPRVRQLVGGAPRAFLYALYDREPLERWTAGRIALLGDAAHPMLPFFAQGAAHAIEDAAVLARCLADIGPGRAETALLRYEQARWERASRVQRLSRGRPARNHLADGEEQCRRDADLASADPVERDAWLYGHDAELDLPVAVHDKERSTHE